MRRKAVTTEMLKTDLAESLLRLLAVKPFAEITVREIADGAGVDRSTYYRHFTSREDVLEDYLDGLVERYIAQVDRTADRTGSLCELFTFFGGYRQELLLLYDNGLANLLLRALNRRISAVVQTDCYRMAYHLGGLFSVFLLWFDRRMTDPPEKMARMADGLLPDSFQPLLRQVAGSTAQENEKGA